MVISIPWARTIASIASFSSASAPDLTSILEADARLALWIPIVAPVVKQTEALLNLKYHGKLCLKQPKRGLALKVLNSVSVPNNWLHWPRQIAWNQVAQAYKIWEPWTTLYPVQLYLIHRATIIIYKSLYEHYSFCPIIDQNCFATCEASSKRSYSVNEATLKWNFSLIKMLRCRIMLLQRDIWCLLGSRKLQDKLKCIPLFNLVIWNFKFAN